MFLINNGIEKKVESKTEDFSGFYDKDLAKQEHKLPWDVKKFSKGI